MRKLKSFYSRFFITDRFFIVGGISVALFATGNYVTLLFIVAQTLLLIFAALVVLDFILIFGQVDENFEAERICPAKMSNGDNNEIIINITNNYPSKIKYEIVDEIPEQFQERNFSIKGFINSNEKKQHIYLLRPTQRGEYYFGKLHVFISSKIGLISKRISICKPFMSAVYPSFIQMRKYEFLAVSNRLTESGLKKIRRISNNKEFEQIKEYVYGDDGRTVNWKATARKSKLMVNQYIDEKSQNIYSIIDMGRTMQMPFSGMSLLDYAVNSTLVLSNIALIKNDKAGLITFSDKLQSLIPAQNKGSQIKTISETLYNLKTNFSESDFTIAYTLIKRKIRQRSLLLFYTNFEGSVSLKRQLPHLINLSKNHLLTVIFFENTELKILSETEAKDNKTIYEKTIAEKLALDKKLIVKELEQNGIHAVLTAPENLTVETVNKYIEFKSKGLI